MDRPLTSADRSLARRIRAFSALGAFVLCATTLARCATPGAIGVQDFGTVQGRVVDGKSNQPISGALVNVGSLYTVRTDPSGVFQLRVPTGDQLVMVQANGYAQLAPIAVLVVKDMTVNAGDSAITLQSTGNP